ncbi:MAG: DUF3667 domain-containing protein [Ignavibacteriaceae bacterium]|nr:DUF3667 domain-containing protein [Ignavibacteriaceae bacterium]
MITCKNCGYFFEGNYCNKCGQTADTERLNFNLLLKHLHKNFIKYFQKGIIYSSTQLFKRPGHTIREYMEGKRIKHVDPIALLIALATLYGVLYHTFGINLLSGISNLGLRKELDFKAVNNWISDHYALLTFLMVPVYSISSFTVFKKQGYNFVEHIFLNTFLANQRLLLRILTFPALAALNGTEEIFILSDLLIFLDVALMMWSYTQFFNKISKIRAASLSVLSYAIFFIFLLIIILVLLKTYELFG